MNYKRYKLTLKEAMLESIKYIACSLMIAFLFYDRIELSLFSLILLPVFLAYRSRVRGVERIKVLRLEFISMIESLSSSLISGLSVTNSLRETLVNMSSLYGMEADIVREIEELISMSEVNMQVTDGLIDFSKRSGIDDIKDFAVIFAEAMRSGGNLTQIIKDSVHIIEEKIRMEEEIDAMLKGKMLEQKVMSVIPFLIIAYLKVTSREFISVLYDNLAGIVVMTACLAIYIGAFALSRRIVNIKI